MSGQDGPGGTRTRFVDFDCLDPASEEPDRRSRVVSFDALDAADDAAGSGARPQPVSFDGPEPEDDGPVSSGAPTAGSDRDDAVRRPASFDGLDTADDASGRRAVPSEGAPSGPAGGRAASGPVSFDGIDGAGRRPRRTGDRERRRPAAPATTLPDGVRHGGTVEAVVEAGDSRTAPGQENPADRTGDPAEARSTGTARSGGRRTARGSGGSRRDSGRARAPEPETPQEVEARAKEICLRLLTDRARTVKELSDALRRKEIPDDVARRVLERFDEVGLVDDEAFAGQWVRSRHRSKGLGRRAIAAELHRKGVAKEVADEALTEIDAESEEARARELVDRKLRSMRVDSKEHRASAARRLVGMLARKGYGSGVAYGVVREAIAARGAEEDELGEAPTGD